MNSADDIEKHGHLSPRARRVTWARSCRGADEMGIALAYRRARQNEMCVAGISNVFAEHFDVLAFVAAREGVLKRHGERRRQKEA